jgi:YVTN family beta-propeller protein
MALVTAAAFMWIHPAGGAETAAALEGTLVAVSPKTSQAFLIDIASKQTRKILEVGKGPHEVAASPDGRSAAVSNYAGEPGNPGNSLTIIDIPSASITKTIVLEPHKKPHGIAWVDTERVLCTSESSNALLLVNVAKGEVERTLPTDQEVSHMLSLSADKKLVATANMKPGTVSILEVASGKKIADVPADAASEGVAISPDGKFVWTGNTKSDTASIIDVDKMKLVKTFPLPGYPVRVAFSNDGRKVFISLPMLGEIAVFDSATMQESARIKAREGSVKLSGKSDPVTIAFHPGGRYAFTSIYSGTDIALIDLEKMAVTDKIGTPASPDGLAYSPIKVKSVE